jgi:acyl carrier protein
MTSPLYLRVIQILAEQLGLRDTAHVRPESTLRELGADSLDDVELVMAFEDEYDIDISDAEAAKLITVGDVVDCIARKTQPRQT